MPVYLGRGSFIAIGTEATWASAVATPVNLRIISETMQRNQERSQKTHLSTSLGAFSLGSFDGMEIAGGSVDLPILYDGTGMLLKAALGDISTSGTGPYAHIYQPATDASLPSLTLVVQRGTGTKEQFLGCKVSTMSISCEAGSEMTASFEFIGKTANSRAAGITPTFGSGAQVFHFEAGTLEYNGVSYNIRSFTLNLDNKVERRDLLGSKQTAEPAITDIREVTMDVTADWEDDNLYNAQIAGTVSDATITFTASSGGGILLKIDLNRAQLTAYEDNINSVGRIERSMTFQGFATSGGDPALRIEITNNDSTGIGN